MGARVGLNSAKHDGFPNENGGLYTENGGFSSEKDARFTWQLGSPCSCIDAIQASTFVKLGEIPPQISQKIERKRGESGPKIMLWSQSSPGAVGDVIYKQYAAATRNRSDQREVLGGNQGVGVLTQPPCGSIAL